MESKNGETTILTTSRFADQKVNPEGLDMEGSLSVAKLMNVVNG